MKVKHCAWSTACLSAGLLLSAPAQQAAAQATAGSASLLEEIVVTARRREETLTDLPLSVAAISADAMQAQGIYNIDQVGEFVPNLTFTNTDRRHVKAIYIRGIGNDSPVSIRPTGTGVYLDGQYLPNTMGQMLSTVDIERIEVMRGPQGTLFGKNTTGGAINIVTQKPTQEFEADVLLRVGDYGQQDLKAMVNVPINDMVAGRFSVMKETMDGHFYNKHHNMDYGAYDVDGFGAAFRITPNDNWIIDFSARANYQNDDDEGVQCRVAPSQGAYDIMAEEFGDAVTSQPAFAPVPGGLNLWGGGDGNFNRGRSNSRAGHIDALYRGATLDFWNDCLEQNQMGPFVTSQEKDTFLKLDNEFVNTTITWDSAGQVGAFENLNFRTILAGQKTDLWYFADRDGSYLPIDALGGTSPRGLRRETRTVELLLTADVSDRLSFIAGYHYFDDESQAGQRSQNGCLAIFERYYDNGMGPFADPNSTLRVPCESDGGGQFDRLSDATSPNGTLNVTGRDGYEVNDSDALFAHLTYDINDNWTVDFGARWTDEQRIFHQLEWDTEPGSCSHNNPGDPPPTALCDADLVLDYSAWSSRGFYNNAELFFSETTPMLSFTRNLGGGDMLEDGMMYFSYAEGFLAGSFNDELNATLTPSLLPLLSYDPEHVNNFEWGFKGTFADGRLRVSTAVFYMDYQDKQETVTIDNSDGRYGADPSLQITANAASVDIYGIELEVRAQPWDGGFLTFDLGRLDNEYGEYGAFDPDSGTTIDRSNLTIEDYSPDWTINASIEHVFQLPNGASITPTVGMYWQSDYDFVEGIDRNAAVSYCFQPAYAKLRGRVTYLPASANWQASLFGSNINDETYFEICGGARSGVFDYRYGNPQVFGLEFQYFWGG